MTDPAAERAALALFERLLEVPAAARNAWIEAETANDPRLRERVTAMRDADRLAQLQTGGATDDAELDTPPERIGAYRIVDRIGRGGMGAVYRGERAAGDFEHVVAIKVIRPGLLADGLAERFAAERATLARLRHPNIAQLYDGGAMEGGIPYLVMEHVDGLPLMAWVAAHDADRVTRQRLFLDMCAAVAFAHGRLVVHRDLTPGNVLVTDDGTVKLIDFGIAKPVEEAADTVSTSDGRPSLASLSLTPGYAAPERMTGGEVTTAVDIYSLGRLLERLLPPQSGDRELRAIVARATAPAPADRYPTAAALRDDVAAWRDGRAVAAMGGGRVYLAQAFIRRHRWGVLAAALAVAVLLVALNVTLAANVRARRATAEAERRFAQTRGIAKAMMSDVYNEVSRVPGATAARLTLARTSLAYLDALANDRDAPPDLQAETGAGYIRLSQVVGGGQQSQLGRYADANALLAKGERILVPLYHAYPARPDVIRAYATLLIEQSGANLYNNNQPELARRQAAAAERLMQPTARQDPDDARRYATAIQAIGDSWGWQDDYARARSEFARAERFQASLPPRLRDQRSVMMARSANLRLWGEAAGELDNKPEAVAVTTRAVAINRLLLAQTPNDPVVLRKMTTSAWAQATALRAAGQAAPALAAITQGMAFARRLLAQSPGDVGALTTLTIAGEVDAQLLADAGRFADSRARVAELVAAHRRLVTIAGDSPGAARTMAAALASGASTLRRSSDVPGACALAREAIGLFEAQRRRGVLTATDENGALADARAIAAAACPRR